MQPFLVFCVLSVTVILGVLTITKSNDKVRTICESKGGIYIGPHTPSEKYNNKFMLY